MFSTLDFAHLTKFGKSLKTQFTVRCVFRQHRVSRYNLVTAQRLGAPGSFAATHIMLIATWHNNYIFLPPQFGREERICPAASVCGHFYPS